MGRSFVRTAGLGALITLSVLGVAAKPTLAVNGSPIKTGAGVITEQPQIVADGNGGSYVCWSDNSNGTDDDVFVARIAYNMIVSGWPKCVTPGKAGDQIGARLVADGSGGVYVVWEDQASGFSNANIYGIRLNSSGAVVSGWGSASPTYGGIAVCASGGAHDPSVSRASDGSLLVAWHFTTAFYAQKMSSAGAAQWSTNGVAASPTVASFRRPSICSDGAAGAYLAYEASGSGFFQQLQSSNGAMTWYYPKQFSSATTGADVDAPVLVSDGGTGAIVAYVEQSTDKDLFLKHYDSGGYASDFSSYYASGDQRAPSLVADGNGGAVVAWYDGRNSGTTGLYASKVLSDGSIAPGWPEDGLQFASSIYLWSNEKPAVSTDVFEGVECAWAISPGDIYGRGANSCGTLQSATALCTEGSNQNAPAITGIFTGQSTIVWRDARTAGTNTGIYALGAATPENVACTAAPTLGLQSGSNMQGLSWVGTASDPIYGDPLSFTVKRSAAPITDSNWYSATTVGTVSVTGPEGTPYCLLATGLTTCTTYYYAAKTNYDGGASAVGANSSQTTKCSAGFGLICDNSLRIERGGEETEAALPQTLEFSAPRPSPARDQTSFDLAIPASFEGKPLTLTIHDLLGRRVRGLIDERAHAGQRSIQWHLDTDAGTRVPRGMYFARLRMGDQVITRTVIAQP